MVRAVVEDCTGSGQEYSPGMRPVTFDGCFGWLHGSARSSGSDTAVVLCAGLGRDVSTAHRPFRLLADQLSVSGFPTLRFDYLGTGDSCDTDNADAVEYLSVWQRSVHAAIDWLLANTQATGIVLVGLRFGATLATLAAATRDEVAGLVLLEPVLRGKSYLAQLSVEARLRGKLEAGAGGLAVDELHLGSDTTRLMAQIDLRQVRLRWGRAIAVFSYAPTPLLLACERAWSATGCIVACDSFTGLEALLRPPHLADEAAADFTPILSWLQAALPPRRRRGALTTPGPQPAELRPAGCIETALRFGTGGRLFGVLCRPEAGDAGRPVVIIGNPGGDPHHGYARFSVEFARRLARAGISSLRMDFAGLGDSISLSDDGRGEGVTHVFEVDRIEDISAAIEALTRLGYAHFALHGLCSGAYHAFQGALADRWVSTLLLINLPWFSLRFERADPTSFARRSMTELAGRQVRMLLLFAGGDVGLKPLEQHFGSGGAELSALPGTLISIEPSLDHDLTRFDMRREAADRMIDFLHRVRPLQGLGTGASGQQHAMAKLEDTFAGVQALVSSGV